MKGYSIEFSPDECAFARVEGVDVSYKDLSEVCGRIRGKDAAWAADFLERVAEGELPVLYKRHCKKIGHRRELGGKKGRYPKKAAGILLKVLRSAIANGVAKGLGEKYSVLSAAANKKATYPRVAPKGGWMRSNYETARVEIVLKASEVPKGVEVRPPAKKQEAAHPKPAPAAQQASKTEPKKTEVKS